MVGGTTVTTTGTWKFVVSGTDLLVQRYDGANWITKTTIVN
jgi:hypothetical protein